VFVQLSDVHVGARRLARGEATPVGELRRAVAAVGGLDVPADLVLLTGDLVDHGASGEYDALLDALAPLPCPFVLVPGNHDDPAVLADVAARRGVPGALARDVGLGPLRLLTLSSYVAGSDGGRVGPDQLAWLDGELAADGRPTVVAVHHPPVPIGHAGLDTMRLADGDALGHVVGRHAHVERIVCGHVHRAVTVRWRGTVVSCAPSVVRQFGVTFGPEVRFPKTDEPPAFVVHAWVGGALASHLVAY
jgi:3',5'-cyclic AMP phosphodiesterase CpdA